MQKFFPDEKEAEKANAEKAYKSAMNWLKVEEGQEYKFSDPFVAGNPVDAKHFSMGVMCLAMVQKQHPKTEAATVLAENTLKKIEDHMTFDLLTKLLAWDATSSVGSGGPTDVGLFLLQRPGVKALVDSMDKYDQLIAAANGKAQQISDITSQLTLGTREDFEQSLAQKGPTSSAH